MIFKRVAAILCAVMLMSALVPATAAQANPKEIHLESFLLRFTDEGRYLYNQRIEAQKPRDQELHPLTLGVTEVQLDLDDYVHPREQLGLYLNGRLVYSSVNSSGRSSTGLTLTGARFRALPGLKTGYNTLHVKLLGKGQVASKPMQLFYIPWATSVYNTAGEHVIDNRWWHTSCVPYSQTVRCRTEISQGATFVFNNLTYLPAMTRAQWSGNPLGRPGEWTSGGREWRTECDTPATGRNACRSYTKIAGRWVVNNIVQFKV